MSNRELFKTTYARNLVKAMGTYPDQYAWPLSELPKVLERMNAAIDKGSFNKDSHAFKWTCKELGIKHTYRDIQEYLRK